MKGSATAYLRGEQVLIHAQSKTTAGVWILSDPVLSSVIQKHQTIAEDVRQALAGSLDKVPHPKIWKGIFEPVLRLAGVKTWATFVKGTMCVNIEAVGDQISFIPTRNRGAEEGFEPIVEKLFVVRSSSNLGDELISSFSRCE